MGLTNKFSKIKFVGLLTIIILVVSTLGCTNSGSNDDNLNSSKNVQIASPTPKGTTISNASAKANIADDARFVYITYPSNNSVSVINTSTNTVSATVPVGLGPIGVAFNPDGTKAYVTNGGSNNVSVIDTATNSVTASVPVGEAPFGVAVNPDGTKVYITKATMSHETTDFGDDGSITNSTIEEINPDYISVIDTVTNIVTTVPVGGVPVGIAVSPEGTKVYVTVVYGNESTARSTPGNISVIDTATNEVVDSVPVGIGPLSVAVTPDGKKIYVVNAGGTVSVIDAATDKVEATVKVGYLPLVLGKFIG
jgi:YVTN family beta-propeller protein